jgi:hypothetical protein
MCDLLDRQTTCAKIAAIVISCYNTEGRRRERKNNKKKKKFGP